MAQKAESGGGQAAKVGSHDSMEWKELARMLGIEGEPEYDWDSFRKIPKLFAEHLTFSPKLTSEDIRKLIKEQA